MKSLLNNFLPIALLLLLFAGSPKSLKAQFCHIPLNITTNASYECYREYQTFYITNPVPGLTYQWQFSSSTGIIVSGQGTDNILAYWHLLNSSWDLDVYGYDLFNQCVAYGNINGPLSANPVTLYGPANVTVCDTSAIYTYYAQQQPSPGQQLYWSWAGGALHDSVSAFWSVQWIDSMYMKWGVGGMGYLLVTKFTWGKSNCYTPDTVFANLYPDPQVSGPLSPCPGDTVSYSTAPLWGKTWSWGINGGNIVGASNQNEVKVVWSGNGSIWVREDNSACWVYDTLQVSMGTAGPTAGFGLSSQNNMVVISDSSSANTTLWQWDFGDGNSSSQASPTHYYSSTGSFTLCQTVSNGCGADTLCDTVNVSCIAGLGGFSFSTNTYTTSFTDESAHADSVLWDFGDGNTSTQQNPQHTYQNLGNFQVCQIVYNACANDTFCKTVTIYCGLPYAEIHLSNSSNATRYFQSYAHSYDSVLYDFGDGMTLVGFSTVFGSVTHTFPGNGTYNVCQIAYNSCGTDTACLQVVVNCGIPQTNFSFSSNNFTATFTNLSSNGSGPNWDFGDGASSSVSNPIHNYAATGNYTVCLITSNACGADTTCQQVTISCPAPQSAFSHTASNFTASFSNQSSGASTYQWDFGDGNSSSQSSPSHSYAANGTYTVCQIATSICGADTTCQQVTINCPAPQSAFLHTASNFTASFSNQSSGASSYQWNFGDGNSSTQASPSHAYAANGTYTVCQIASGICGADTTCQQVTISCPAPQSAFSHTSTNFTASFSNQSSGASAYQWNFGDGNSSTQASPSHAYAANGTYTVCQIAIGICGADTTCQQVTINCPAPQSGFSHATNNFTANFTNQSIGATSYQWNFGDGGSSNQASPSHTYTFNGTYTVCQIATGICGSDTTCQQVTINCPAPQSAFSYFPSNLTAIFTNLSSNASSYSWNFGDGNTSTQSSPSHTYAANGTYTVCLNASGPCGSNAFCQQVSINCPSPQSVFSFTTSGFTTTFTNLATNANSYVWTFGDGGSSSFTNPSYTYLASGTYNVCLIANGICGSDTSCQQVTITCPAPQSTFSFTTNNFTATFTNQSNNSSSYLWRFGDGNSSTQANPIHNYAANGTYDVCLIANGTCGSDTLCQQVTVNCPVPQSSFAYNVIADTVFFSDLSTGQGINWSWSFGDGTFSTQQNPWHTYPFGVSFLVCLNVQSACGNDSTCELITLTGLAGQKLNCGLSVYPNPGRDGFWLEMEGCQQPLHYELYDALGKLILRNDLKSGLRQWQHAGELAEGIYLLKAGNHRKRIIIRR